MKIKILPCAIKDLHHGRIFYTKQDFPVGIYFFDSIFSDVDSLTLFAGIHSKHFGFYRLLASKFPFGIYYKIENEFVIVWRVLDLRQNPVTIDSALQNREPTNR